MWRNYLTQGRNSIATEYVLTRVYIMIIFGKNLLTTARLDCGLKRRKNMHLECGVEIHFNDGDYRLFM